MLHFYLFFRLDFLSLENHIDKYAQLVFCRFHNQKLFLSNVIAK